MYERLLAYGYKDISCDPEFEDDIINEIIVSCWCDKLGTKICYTNSAGCENYSKKL